MKLIRTDNQITSLEEIKEVSTYYSKAMKYSIHVEYMNGQSSCISFIETKEKANDLMNQIYNILKGE